MSDGFSFFNKLQTEQQRRNTPEYRIGSNLAGANQSPLAQQFRQNAGAMNLLPQKQQMAPNTGALFSTPLNPDPYRPARHYEPDLSYKSQELLDWENRVTSAADFAPKSQYQQTGSGEKKINVWKSLLAGGNGLVYEGDEGYVAPDETYELVNRNKDVEVDRFNRRLQESHTSGDGPVFRDGGTYAYDTNALAQVDAITTDPTQVYKQMTSSEIGVYNYIYATEGPEAAKKYLDELTPELNYRNRKAEEKEFKQVADEHPVQADFFRTFVGPMKGLALLHQTEQMANTGTIDQNAPTNKYSYIPTTVTNRRAQNVGEWMGSKFENKQVGQQLGQWLYGLGASMSDNLYMMALTGGAQGGKLGEGALLAMMGSGVAADTVIASKDKGLSDAQAYWIGMLAGGIEAATELIGLDNLYKTNWSGAAFGQLVKLINNQGLAEGSEEFVGSVANQIADLIVAGQDAELYQTIKGYMADGVPEKEAVRRAITDWFSSEVIPDTAAGYVSGVLFGAGASAMNFASMPSYYAAIGQRANQVSASPNLRGTSGAIDAQVEIDKALSGAGTAKAAALARQVQSQMQGGRAPKDTTLGRLIVANMDAQSDVMRGVFSLLNSDALTDKERDDILTVLAGELDENGQMLATETSAYAYLQALMADDAFGVQLQVSDFEKLSDLYKNLSTKYEAELKSQRIRRTQTGISAYTDAGVSLTKASELAGIVEDLRAGKSVEDNRIDQLRLDDPKFAEVFYQLTGVRVETANKEGEPQNIYAQARTASYKSTEAEKAIAEAQTAALKEKHEAAREARAARMLDIINRAAALQSEAEAVDAAEATPETEPQPTTALATTTGSTLSPVYQLMGQQNGGVAEAQSPGPIPQNLYGVPMQERFVRSGPARQQSRAEQIRSEQRQLRTRRSEIRAQHDVSSAESVQNIDARMTAANQELKALRAEHEQLEKRHAQLDENIKRLENLEQNRHLSDKQSERLNNLVDEYYEIEKKLEGLDNRIAELENQLSELSEGRASEIARIEALTDEERAEIEQLESRMTELKTELAEETRKIEEAQREAEEQRKAEEEKAEAERAEREAAREEEKARLAAEAQTLLRIESFGDASVFVGDEAMTFDQFKDYITAQEDGESLTDAEIAEQFDKMLRARASERSRLTQGLGRSTAAQQTALIDRINAALRKSGSDLTVRMATNSAATSTEDAKLAEEGKHVNASWDKATGTITFSPDMTTQEIAQWVLAHEVLHQAAAYTGGSIVDEMQNAFKAMYDAGQLSGRVKDIMDNWDDEVEYKRRLHNYADTPQGRQDAKEELIGDMMRHVLPQTKFWNNFAQLRTPLAVRISNKLNGLTDGNSAFNTEAQKLADKLESALHLTEEQKKTRYEQGKNADQAAEERAEAAREGETAGDAETAKHSVSTLMATMNLHLDKNTGRWVDAKGNTVTEITRDMVRNSGVGMLITSAAAEWTDKRGNVTKPAFISEEDAQKQLDGARELFNMVLKAQDGELVWRFAGAAMFSAIKSNSDKQYSTTIDFSTVCRKTAAMMTAMSKAMLQRGHGLTREEVIKLQNEILQEEGQVPCPVCYVFSRWAGVGGILENMNKWQKKYDESWTDEMIQQRMEELRDATATTDALREMLFKTDSEYREALADKESARQQIDEFKKQRKDAKKPVDDLTKERNKLARRKNPDAAAIAELDAQIETANEVYEARVKEIDGQISALEDQIEEADKTIKDLEKDGAPELAWLERVRSKPDYWEHGYVEESLLFNLDDAETLAKEKPLAWGYRTSRGPAAGKAILPYSDIRFGDFILGTGENSSVDQEGKSRVTTFSYRAQDENGNDIWLSNATGTFDKDQVKAIRAALKRTLAQNLIGGQRYQSTSDFRYDYGLDYLQSFWEAQALGSKLQTYTKVVEFAELAATIGGDVNLSVMPLEKGWVSDTENWEDGHLVFSSVTGMNPEAAIRINAMFSNVQLILVGINDENIRLALRDDARTGGNVIGFVIPYHASGASINTFIRGLVQNLGEDFVETNYKDYSPVQTDHERKDATKAQKQRAKLRKTILTEKNWTPTAAELQSMRGRRSKDIAKMSFEELRAVELKALAGDAAAIREYESWSAGVLWDMYQKMWVDSSRYDTYGVRLTSEQSKTVMPHEYWNTKVDRDHAYINGFIFRSYCYSLGLVPRFTGINSSGKNIGYGDFSMEPGYWKTLIDRPMYDLDGNYRAQQTLNVTNLSPEMITPAYGNQKWSGYTTDTADDVIAERAARNFNEKYPPQKYSISQKQDTEYMAAVNSGDMGTAQRMVDEAAKAAGYTVKVYHGTYSFGRTSFSKYDGVLFLTDSVGVARNFSGGAGERTINSKFDAETASFQKLLDWVNANTWLNVARPAQREDFIELIDRWAPLTKAELKKYGMSEQDNVERNKYREQARELLSRFDSGENFAHEDYNPGLTGTIPNSGLSSEQDLREFAAVEAAKARNGGVYDLLLNPGNSLTINCHGHYYTDIPIPAKLKPYATKAELARRYATSDQIVRMAYAAGLDSVKLADVVEGGDYGNAGKSNVYVSLNAPRFVKSADPVTYDSEGNVIPLSERFNSENNDIRYSISRLVNTDGMTEEQIANAAPVVQSVLQRGQFADYFKSEYASYTTDRIDHELEYSIYEDAPDTTRTYVAWIDPRDFVRATTDNSETAARIKAEAGELDVARMRAEYQTPYLRIDFGTGEIRGHEGRHRMQAMADAGINYAPVLMDDVRGANTDAQPISIQKLEGQFSKYRGFYLHNALPVDTRYAEVIKKAFGAPRTDVKFSISDQRTPAPTFYSQAQRVVEQYKGDKIGASSLVPYLKGHGVKSEEIKWSGIEQFLEGKKSVTKDEVLQFLRENDLDIEIIVKDSATERQLSAAVDKLKADIKPTIEAWNDEFDPWDSGDVTLDDYRQVVEDLLSNDDNELIQLGRATRERLQRWLLDADDVLNDLEQAFELDGNGRRRSYYYEKELYGESTNWDDYKVPGGTNYREYVYRLPDGGTGNLAEVYSNDAMQAHWGYDADNILVHARVQDFPVAIDAATGEPIADPETGEARPVLFVDEIQSDWHNAGHKYAYESNVDQRIEQLNKKRDSLVGFSSEFLRSQEDLHAQERAFIADMDRETLTALTNALDGYLESASMTAKESWLVERILGELSKYRNLDDVGDRVKAAQEDLHAAFGEGAAAQFLQDWQRQSDKAQLDLCYDLENLIKAATDDTIEVLQSAIGAARVNELFDLIARIEDLDAQHEAWARRVDRDLPQVERQLEALESGDHVVPDAPYSENYTDYVLKQLLREAAENGYSFLAWTPGWVQEERWSDEYSKGYAIEYDQDIPSFLSKYGKQWGARLQNIELQTDDFTTITVRAIPITDSMRESVIYTGQPKYSISPRMQRKFDDLLAQYGPQEPSSRDARDVEIPKQSAENNYVSRTARTVANANPISEEGVDAVKKLIVGGKLSFLPESNKTLSDKAEKWVRDVGWGEAIRLFINDVSQGRVNGELVARGAVLLNNASNGSDAQTFSRLMNYYTQLLHNAAMGLEAAKIIQQLTPDGQLAGIMDVLREVNATVKRLNKAERGVGEITLSDELVAEYRAAKTDEARDTVVGKMAAHIASQIRTTNMDRWTAIRYLNMLGNFKTQVRNLAGNLIMQIMRFAKDTVAGAIDAVANADDRTVSVAIDKDSFKSGWDLYHTYAATIMGGGRYNDSMATGFMQQIEDKTQVFGKTKSELLNKTVGKAAEKYRTLTKDAMEKGDSIFCRWTFAESIGRFMAANHTTWEKATEPMRARAINKAIRDAAEATYHDNNALSTWVSNIARSSTTPRAARMLMEGIMPFRKTPANIAMRAYEYGPLSLIENTIKTIQYERAKNGKGNKSLDELEITGADIVNRWAKSFTGSVLVAIGVALAASGNLLGKKPDDEKEAALWEQMGYKEYSLRIGKMYWTLDWAAPACIPLFLGANLADAGAQNGLTLREFLGSVTRIADPLVEMSMLQGINDTIENAANYGTDSALGNLLINATWGYFSQGLSNTLLGQIKRASRNTRMQTYVDKNKALPDSVQRTVGKTSAKIPGWNYNQIPYIDAWGNVEQNIGTENSAGNAFANVLYQGFSPAYGGHRVNESELLAEIDRLYKATGNKSVILERPDKYFNVKDENGVSKRLDLTADQYVVYAQTRGQTAQRVVSELINSQVYQTMTDHQKAEAIKEAYDYANQIGKNAVTEQFSLDSTAREVHDGAYDLDIPEAVYMTAYSQAKNYTENWVNAQGEKVQNSKSLLLMNDLYTNYPELSQDQILFLAEALGVNKTVRGWNKALVASKVQGLYRMYGKYN